MSSTLFRLVNDGGRDAVSRHMSHQVYEGGVVSADEGGHWGQLVLCRALLALICGDAGRRLVGVMCSLGVWQAIWGCGVHGSRRAVHLWNVSTGVCSDCA